MAAQERHDCTAERVVAIAGHHVRGVFQVDVLGVRNVLEEFTCVVFGDDVAETTSDQQNWKVDLCGIVEAPLDLGLRRFSVRPVDLEGSISFLLNPDILLPSLSTWYKLACTGTTYYEGLRALEFHRNPTSC